MKEIGLMFQDWGVRAILEGRKVQTRRLAGLRYVNIVPDEWRLEDGVFENATTGNRWQLLPQLQVGDTMYVKEVWGELGWHEGDVPIHEIDGHQIIYRAEVPEFQWLGDDESIEYRKDGYERSHWKSAMFMPKAYARIRKPITRVRIQRLQDISEEDAQAEGIERLDLTPRILPDVPPPSNQVHPLTSTYKEAYQRVWNQINGPGSWEKNPWVWVYEWDGSHVS